MTVRWNVDVHETLRLFCFLPLYDVSHVHDDENDGDVNELSNVMNVLKRHDQ